MTKHTDKTIFRLLFIPRPGNPRLIIGTETHRRITGTFNWMHRVEWLFSPGRKIHYFRTLTPFPAAQHTSTSVHIHQFDTTKSNRVAKTPGSIDTFTHQEKYQLFVFTWSTATPPRSIFPAQPRILCVLSTPRAPCPPLYTASDIRHCARCRYTDETSALARRRK